MQAYRKDSLGPEFNGQFDKLTDRTEGTPVPELAEGATSALHPCLLLFYCPQAHPLRWVGLP